MRNNEVLHAIEANVTLIWSLVANASKHMTKDEIRRACDRQIAFMEKYANLPRYAVEHVKGYARAAIAFEYRNTSEKESF